MVEIAVQQCDEMMIDPIKFSSFVEWAFLGVVSGGVYILWQMKESVSNLNTKIEVLITQHEQAKNKIDDHESRIRDLEKD